MVAVCSTTSGCSLFRGAPPPNKPIPQSGIVVTFKRGDRDVVLDPRRPGKAPGVSEHTIIEVVDKTNGHPIPNVRVSVSRDPMLGGLETRGLPATSPDPAINGHSFRAGEIQPPGIPHRRFIVLSVQGNTASDTATYYLRYIDRWRWWNGLTSPILYRAQGSVSKFGVDDFAPSLAFGPRWFTGGGTNDYIGFNALVTVYRIAADEPDQDRPYSLGVGGVIDIRGILQVGANYQAKDEKTYLIFGVRPEVWKF